MLFGLLLGTAMAGEIVVANNLRVTYDFGHDIKPYLANEIKIIKDDEITFFDANKFRAGFRYKINNHVRIDPHLFIDNKRKDDWIFSPGPALRVDLTF
tara:strand:+ start:249 stop:542 length:294 start_codon:yes stop_codon:yes gene_type:complete